MNHMVKVMIYNPLSFIWMTSCFHVSFDFISPEKVDFPGGSDSKAVKRLSAMWETRVQSLGWEDPLEKEMAIHSRIIAWKIPWTEEPGRHSPWGRKELDMTE